MDDDSPLQRSNELWRRAVEIVRSTRNENEPEAEREVAPDASRSQDEYVSDPDLEAAPKLQILNEALAVAKQKEDQDRHRRLKIRGRGDKEYVVWEIYGQIAEGIQKFKDIGDVLVNIDPLYAAAPWALCRAILLLATAKYEAHCLMLSQLEKVTDLIYYFRTFEKIYLTDSEVSAARSTLEASLTKLYSTILYFLLKAKKYFTKQKGFQRAKGNFQAVFGLDSKTQELVSSIASQQEEIHRRVPLLHHERQNRLLSWAHEITEDLSNLQKRVDQVRGKEERSRNSMVLDWLSTTNVTRQHEITCDGRLDKSGSWLLEGQDFSEWRSAPRSSILWLHGSAGFGKTKLVSAIVDKLQQSSDSRLAYFYCNRGTGDGRSQVDHLGIFRSLLRQVATVGPGPIIDAKLRALYEQREDQSLGEPRELQFDEAADLIIAISQKTPVTILLDALDECKKSSWTIVVDKLFELVDRGRVKVLLSSRNYGRLSRHLKRAIDVSLGEQQNAGDIRRFIQHEVTTREFECELTHALQDEIITRLQSTANGMFLWAKLQIDDLCNAKTVTAFRRRLGRLPRDLDTWYAENFAQIDLYAHNGYDTEYSIATATLNWLRCANVSMSGDAFLAAVGLAAEDPNRARDIILDVCHNLVLYDASSSGYRFQHLSVREFLESSSSIRDNEVQLHHFAAERCLEFLLKVPAKPEQVTPAEREFHKYATLQFLQHLSKVNVRDNQLQSKVDEFLDRGLEQKSPLDRWISNCKELLKSSPNQDLSCVLAELEEIPTPDLFGACIFGSTNVIDRCSSIDVYSGTGKTPLCLAVENKHRHVVAQLFERFKSRIKIDRIMVKANVQLEEIQSARIMTFAKALDTCSAFRNGNVWELADAQRALQAENHPDRIIPATALQAAIASGDFKLVEYLLLEQGANHSMSGGYCGDALQTAVISHPVEPKDSSQHVKIVDLLLKEGAVVNSQGGFCGSPLLAAARLGQEATLLRLLEQGPEDSTNGGEYYNVLHAAVMSGRKTVVEFILKSYPNLINLPSRYGTPLHRAAGLNSLDIVGLLLEYKADINAVSALYESALVPAARLGHKQVINLLISRGANVNHISKSGRELLLRQAAFHGIPELAKILLSGSMDVNIRGADIYKFTPLHYAAHAGHTDLIHLLAERGARDGIMDRNFHSFSPLDDAGRHGRVGAIHQLVNEFAKLKGERSVGEFVNAQSPRDKNTAMHRAAENGHVDCVIALIDYGAKILHNHIGATPVHCAAWDNRFELVRAFLELDDHRKALSGFDVNVRNNSGKTPLHDSAERGFPEIARLLLDNGADPWIRSEENFNVFHWAGFRGHGAVIETLFEHFAKQQAALGEPAKLLNERGGDDHRGATPLQDVLWHHPFLIKMFLEHGAKIIHDDNDYQNPTLFRCIGENRLHNARTFIEHAADIYEQTDLCLLLDRKYTKDEATLLHRACADAKSPDLTQFLLEKGADPSITDARGWTPLHAAADHGTVKTAEILAQAWPDGLYVRAQDGRTPLEQARTRSNTGIIELLESLG